MKRIAIIGTLKNEKNSLSYNKYVIDNNMIGIINNNPFLLFIKLFFL